VPSVGLPCPSSPTKRPVRSSGAIGQGAAGSEASTALPIRPMTLGSMRQNGVRGLFVTCSACGYHAEVNVDAWPDDVPVPSRACGVPSTGISGLPRDRIGAGAGITYRAAAVMGLNYPWRSLPPPTRYSACRMASHSPLGF